MLLAFRCKNFRSFKTQQEFSLVAGRTRSPEYPNAVIEISGREEGLLRCAAIYGANASGKSNVLRAMSTFSRMVSESHRNWKPTGRIPAWDPFSLDLTSPNGQTEFEADLTVGALVYRYGFCFDEEAVRQEWLIDITARPKVLFRRSTKGPEVSLSLPGRNLGMTSDESRRLESIRLQTRPNSLFLSSAAQSNHERLLPIYKWITDSFHVISPRDWIEPRDTAEMCANLSQKAQVMALLSFADVGIVDLEVSEEQIPEKTTKVLSAMFAAMKEVNPDSPVDLGKLAGKSQPAIRMFHRGAGGESFSLMFRDESAGTRAFFYLLGPLLTELKQGNVLLIDEFGSSLHTNLARQLVKILNNSSSNGEGAQIIFATHDTTLLDPDLLRRDQIWFTEKDQEGATSLSQLSQYKPRKDQDLGHAYLNGRFGAVPFLDEEVVWNLFDSQVFEEAEGSQGQLSLGSPNLVHTEESD